MVLFPWFGGDIYHTSAFSLDPTRYDIVAALSRPSGGISQSACHAIDGNRMTSTTPANGPVEWETIQRDAIGVRCACHQANDHHRG